MGYLRSDVPVGHPEFGKLEVCVCRRSKVADLVRDNAVRWAEILDGDGVADRPRPDVWSPLEYACHVRDVFRIFRERLALMVASEAPDGAQFANWDQDATAVEQRYGEQDPTVVREELTEAAQTLAANFASVSGDQWTRRGRRSDGAAFTIESFARYLIHDPVHHLYDVAGRRA